MIIKHATWDGCLPESNDQRRSIWGSMYYASGFHRNPQEDKSDGISRVQSMLTAERETDAEDRDEQI